MPEFISQWLPVAAMAFLPHGYCFQWIPNLLSLHVISDVFIALAYFSIPLTLWYFVRRRSDLPFKWIFMLFAAFIVACGSSHLMSIITVWYPVYWLAGWVKALTAAVSVITAAVLVPLMPRALALPSPSELQAYNNTLEGEVARRTQELEETNQQLEERLIELQGTQKALRSARVQAEQARQAAEQANRSKSRFLATMSHELRTPLNGILGYAQFLQHSELPERLARGVLVIQRSGEHLLSLINDILDLARVESGHLELHPGEVDLEPLLQGVVEPLRIQAEQKGLTMRLEFTRPLPSKVRADARRLRQILVNLLGNAVKFSDTGEVSLQVVPTETAIEFVVRDTGPGISDEDRELIFEPFRQLGADIKGGSGLGLSITRDLVALMDGQMHVSSTPGEGSEFCISLPLLTVNQSSSSSGVEDEIIGYQGAQRCILVVDDYQDNRQVADALLTSLGFQVMCAANATQAMAMLTEHKIDLVLMDLVMPGVNGLMLTRQIKANVSLAHTPVVMASASAFEYHRSESREAGAEGFLAKPLQRSELLKVIGEQLHLEWLFHSDATILEPPASSPGDTPALVFDADQIQQILDLARVGHNRALKAYLKALEVELGTSPGIAYLLQLTEQFRHEAICDLLKPLLDASSRQ